MVSDYIPKPYTQLSFRHRCQGSGRRMVSARLCSLLGERLFLVQAHTQQVLELPVLPWWLDTAVWGGALWECTLEKLHN